MKEGSTFFKSLILAFACMGLTGSPLPGQIYLKSGTGLIEHRVVKGATVTLQIVTYRGALQWQQSENGTSWMDWAGKTGSSVQFLASLGIYLRVAVTSENCDPVYSEVVHVITFESPEVQTAEVTNITTNEAQCGGTVTNDGGDPVTGRGVCWSVSPSPVITDNHTLDGTGTGTFQSFLTGLNPNTQYFVRAYATNGAGTAYGKEQDFTTNKLITNPVVTTAEVTAVGETSATCGGNVTDNGGSAVLFRGVCWNTTGNPTTGDNKTRDGSGTGSFTSNLGGLTAATKYFVRAYATNSAGTGYGNEREFMTKTSVSLPTVITADITGVTQTTATGGGNVTSDGGATVTARGVCWNTTGAPTTADSKTADGSGTGSFVSNLTSLTAGTAYSARAYAINTVGTAYGTEIQFNTLPAGEGTFDYEGKTYKYLTIGTQVWMAENLAWLPSVSPRTVGSLTQNYYYVYGYEGTDVAAAKLTENYTVYGVLYNWTAAKTACPPGWHLPSEAEWTILKDFLGTDAGGKMKETGTTHWQSPNTGATNESLFSGRPAGYREYHGNWGGIGQYGYFWSTDPDWQSAGVARLSYNLADLRITGMDKASGISVRCLKN